MSIEDVGLRCGIEIHQQLEGKKLFCRTPTRIRDDEPDYSISRKLRASAGESGTIDVAAAQEQIIDRTFIYQGYKDSISLVELDEEPPHSINEDALHTSLQFVKMVNSQVSPVIQVMRKTVADGSNTSGFQRTALISRGGKIETSEGDVRIANISIEEDSCRIISNTPSEKTYRLDRLGIPLIEIGTEPDIRSADQCKEAAQKIGMLLRSLPGIKRGLGTIRQDVNVSIRGGARVEIKGAQDLKMIPTLVELEAKRQQELLSIRDSLELKELNELDIIDCSQLFKDTDAKVIKRGLEDNGKVLVIKLEHFAGLIGKEIQPDYRLGIEFSGRAKIIAGVGGIFHSDELPNYGILQKEVDVIREKLHCENNDGFILVAAPYANAKRALEAVYQRAKELLIGIPQEVRKANSDGTTSYMRPMPGAARMYPETDVPLIFPDVSSIELPELLDDKAKRFAEEFSLGKDLSIFIVKSSQVDLFEELVALHPKMKPAFIAETLTSTVLEIKRKYNVDPNVLTSDNFRSLFTYLDQGKIHKDIVLDVLIDMIKGNFDIANYESLSTEEIHTTIQKIVNENKDAPFGALMGQCMKALAGKASGQIISQNLKTILEQGHE